MNRILNPMLNLRPGDFSRGWPFFVYLFLVIASYVTGQAASNALFMERFKADQLPYVDIATTVLVGVVVALYIRISRRTALNRLLIFSLLFLSANAFAFWWAAHHSGWFWLFPVLYVWVGIFGVLAPMQAWTLANYVWTTREAKRLFSMLGSGAILGGIFGGLWTKYAATWFGTESLLLAIGFFMLPCAVCVEIIWRGRAPTASSAEDVSDAPKRTLAQSLGIIRDSRLLQMIAILICISSVTTA